MKEQTFFFKQTQWPVEYNLYQHLTALHYRFCDKSPMFSDKNLALPEKHCRLLEEKHQLAELLIKEKRYFMPKTVTIDALSLTKVIQSIKQTKGVKWLLKPALLNNGQGIRLFNNLNELNSQLQKGALLHGPHVLQQYIAPPDLIDGYKYSLRYFMLLTNKDGCFLYPQGYINFCDRQYEEEITYLDAHLSNEHLVSSAFHRQKMIPKDKKWARVYQVVKKQCADIMRAYYQKTNDAALDENLQAWTLFGIDFMLDSEKKVWLLEINHRPCFPKSRLHPLYTPLYKAFWTNITQYFVLPLMHQRPFDWHHSHFEKLPTDLSLK